MDDKKVVGDIIYKLRREHDMSQTELAQKIGVTNKAVSKWETYEANPDLNNLVRLAEVFNVSCDELLKGEIKSKAEAAKEKTDETGHLKSDASFFGIKGVSHKTEKSFEFVSEKSTKKGKPYVHVNLGLNENGSIRKANGVIALGIIAKGIISCGVISCGVLSVGVLSVGLLAFGMVCIGALISAGMVAIGFGVSVGAVAVGAIAVGGVAIGGLSVGALSVGVYSHTGVFGKAIGLYIFKH